MTPFKIVTFHQKGNGKAVEIVQNSLDLIKEIIQQYPKLVNVKFSNTEADPIVTWSTPRDFQADLRYGVTVFETIALFWNEIFEKNLNLESISHDNAFLSYFPNQFTQRTLLARFQMNNTVPVHTQFFLKPVFLALSMISNLGNLANKAHVVRIRTDYNLTVLETCDKDPGRGQIYLGTMLSLSGDVSAIEVRLKWNLTTSAWFYTIEYLTENSTSSYKIWKSHGSPDFPTKSLRNKMRKGQELLVQIPPQPVQPQGEMFLNLTSPVILLVRFCDLNYFKSMLLSVVNLRFNKVNNEEVLILWSDVSNDNLRCIYEYEIYFMPEKPSNGPSNLLKITRNRHVTVMNFQFVQKSKRRSPNGCYKVRAVNIMGRKGPFSKIVCYKNKIYQ